MKWPLSITLIRHGESTYNELKNKKTGDETYQKFLKAFKENCASLKTVRLAKKIMATFTLKTSDYYTPLTNTGIEQSRAVAEKLKSVIPVPHVILYSPYFRTRDTLRQMMRAWPELKKAKIVSEDRVREQEHGLTLLYNDWRVFQALHPEQKLIYDLLGSYWYQYPQGESISQVRDRIRLLTNTLIREYSSQHVMIITHHLTILSIRANYERLTPEKFIELDQTEKPINCGVTIYNGNTNTGKNGKLELQCYNAKFY